MTKSGKIKHNVSIYLFPSHISLAVIKNSLIVQHTIRELRFFSNGTYSRLKD